MQIRPISAEPSNQIGAGSGTGEAGLIALRWVNTLFVDQPLPFQLSVPDPRTVLVVVPVRTSAHWNENGSDV